MIAENRTVEPEAALETALRKLEVCESTLRAIGHGEVDALVVSRKHGEEIHKIMKVGGIADSLFNLVYNPTFLVDAITAFFRSTIPGKRP